jgi:hypothetical protein
MVINLPSESAAWPLLKCLQSLFSNLTPDCSPVVTKATCHSAGDYQFIASEVKRLLEEGIIELSNSPWCDQAFVLEGDNHKTRMVIDYSQELRK